MQRTREWITNIRPSLPRIIPQASADSFLFFFLWVTPVGAPRASIVEGERKTDPEVKFAELCVTLAVLLSVVRTVKLSHKAAKIFCKI